VEPRRDAGQVRFRIDGVLHQVYAIPTPVLVAMTSRIKLLARMEIVEKRRPQDGRIKTVTPAGEEVELRISTMPTAFGEKVVMRIFTPEVLVRDFAELGFTVEDRERWGRMIKEPNGIILVTGPTGSGKTTTLYSSLKQLATPEVNVCTVEDPIEMIEPLFNQMQVQPAIGVDFAHGVRTLMRQDPDIIMVGEIRDRDTADMAVQAALTGHLVLSSLHTNDAPDRGDADARSRHAAYLISSTLLGVMAQRLVRTLCPHCKEPGDPPDDETWRAITSPWRADKPTQGHGAGGLPRMPDDRLPRADGPVRDHADDPRDQKARDRRDGRRENSRAGVQGRHEAAARLRCDESRCRPHHRGRGREGRASRLARRARRRADVVLHNRRNSGVVRRRKRSS
jgi:general secretion pathway protein E